MTSEILQSYKLELKENLIKFVKDFSKGRKLKSIGELNKSNLSEIVKSYAQIVNNDASNPDTAARCIVDIIEEIISK